MEEKKRIGKIPNIQIKKARTTVDRVAHRIVGGLIYIYCQLNKQNHHHQHITKLLLWFICLR